MVEYTRISRFSVLPESTLEKSLRLSKERRVKNQELKLDDLLTQNGGQRGRGKQLAKRATKREH